MSPYLNRPLRSLQEWFVQQGDRRAAEEKAREKQLLKTKLLGVHIAKATHSESGMT